jgi:hypothetical protein
MSVVFVYIYECVHFCILLTVDAMSLNLPLMSPASPLKLPESFFMRFYGMNELPRPLTKESKRALHFAVLDAIKLQEPARNPHERMSACLA